MRPSAYAIIANDSGEIAIVTTRTGCYLPGGGLERDETPESAVARECREECGFAIRNLRYLGSAVQKLFAPGEGWFRLEGAFYVADGDRPRLQPN